MTTAMAKAPDILMPDAKLKQGWTRVAFGDVVKLNRDTCKDPLGEGIERFVGLEHIDSEDLKIRRWGNVADGITFTNRFKPGQVLFGKRRSYLRKVAVAEFEGICSGDIYVFEAKPKHLLPELLPFICQTDAFFDYAIGTSAGSMSPRTNWKSLANYEFALPPIDEQRRMAEVLWGVKNTLDGLETVLDSMNVVRLSLLYNWFGDVSRQSNRNGYKIVKMRDAGNVLMGRQRAPKYQTGRFTRPYLRVANVFDGHINTNDVLTMDFDEKEFKNYRLVSGDILLNEGQSRELVGRSSIFKGEVDNCCFQNTLIRFRPSDDVLSEYAHIYFQYCLYSGYFSKVSKQTTSIAHLGVLRFAESPFPLLSIPQQRILVDQIRKIDNLKSQIQGRSRSMRLLLDQVIGNMVER